LETIKNRLERMGLWDKIVKRELKSLWKYGVEKISDLGIKASVIDFLSEEAPLSFFLNPASPSGRHHPTWQNGKCGMLRNTTECCLLIEDQLKMYHDFCDAEDNVLSMPRDIVLAATILSDTFKYDKEIVNGHEVIGIGKVNKNHGKVAAQIWRDKYRARYPITIRVTNEIFQAVYWHLGRWTEGWTPQTKFSLLTQITQRMDVIFADKNLELLYRPRKAIK